MNNNTVINVGIEDMKTASGKYILRTTLGSCVAVCLYDPAIKSGGMVHIMLPSIEETKNTNGSPMKYADSAIPLLLYELLSQKCVKGRIYAKIAGGAQMFNIAEGSIISAISKNNIAKVKAVLQSLGLPIKGEDTGGDFSRTIFFDLETGAVTVKSANRPNLTL